MDDCHLQYAMIIGDCKFCKAKFCSKHRLPEAHDCPHLQTCRQAQFDKNKEKVMGEQCVAAKV